MHILSSTIPHIKKTPTESGSQYEAIASITQVNSQLTPLISSHPRFYGTAFLEHRNVRYMTIGSKKYYLNTPLYSFEYMWILLALIT